MDVRWVVVLAIFGAAFFAHVRFGHPGRSESESGRIRRQLLGVAIVLGGGLAVILALPDASVRKDLLSLFGLILSAMIALASSTFLGNVLAGAMLRSIDNLKPGDWVQAKGQFGRVTVRGLFAVEIQTEDRDLVTIPNLLLVNEPVKVIRTSGTVLSADVSLGYDVSRLDVERHLLEAAESAGLEEPFVQLLELGDFSVVYRVAGLQRDVGRLISARSELREAMVDHLHAGGIEIVSPSFMNQRRLDSEPIIATAPIGILRESTVDGEDVAFDKANVAGSLQGLRDEHARLVEQAAALDELHEAADDEVEQQSLASARRRLANRIERLGAGIASRESDLAAIDAAATPSRAPS
ncbi:MAG: mechanosensitive ion channel family protein [Planctomycetota bacterium]